MTTGGNTILIIGGSSGAGAALARSFLQLGNEAILCGASELDLESAMRASPGLHTLSCDITVESDREMLLQLILEYFPRVNILVNDSATPDVTDLKDASAATRVANELRADFHAPVLLMLKLLPHLMERPRAAIVNIFGSLPERSSDEYPIHRASVAGLMSFSDSLRSQLEGSTVAVIDVFLSPPAPANGMSPARSVDVAKGILAAGESGIYQIRGDAPRARSALVRFVSETAASFFNR